MQNIWQNCVTVKAVEMSDRSWFARFHFAPSKNFPEQQPVERDIAKEATLRRLGPSLTNN
jgi:hypothetical protein